MSTHTNSYLELLTKLLSINKQGGMKLGLQNAWALDTSLGSPSKAFPSVHIAGTNGKGSVSTKIAAALRAAGFNVGLYTSPHLSCFRERIRINGEMISEGRMQEILAALFSLIETKGIRATFFELATALAFRYFADARVDIAVVETGLGGRLDATNILRPKLSIITSISLEHIEILGGTIESITREKCGIIKPQVPVVIGPHVFEKIVEEYVNKGASLLMKVTGHFADYHQENQAIARRALEFLQVESSAITSGLEALPPCRFEIFQKEQLPSCPFAIPEAVVFDVAHNPNGFSHLLEAIKNRFPNQKLRFVIGMSKNKDIKSCFEHLKEHAEHVHLIEAENERAAAKEFLSETLTNLGCTRNSCERSIYCGMQQAMQQAALNHQILIICGSFFIMAAARKALGIEEPWDPIDLNERLK